MFRRFGASQALIIAVLGIAFLCIFSGQASATTGINQQLSFQGKIVTAAGVNIPDGTYNMEFKIYTAAGSCNPTTGAGCTLGWTEDWLVSNTQGVTLTSGTYQVNLDSIAANNFSGIDFNTYPLYLSLQIGSTGSCTPAGNFTANCAGDGEMMPYILLTSTPYALNAGLLGGLAASSFAQLSGTNIWAGTNTFNSQSTFNTDVDYVFNGTENIAVTSDLAGTVDVLSLIATPSSTAGTTQGILVQQANSANTNGLDNGLTINNADTDLPITAALKIQNSGGGGYTTIIDNQGTLISGAELNLLDGHSSALVDTATTGTIAITGTGILGAGSIASGFGAIDVGADNITTTGTHFGNTFDRSTAGQLSIGNGGASAATSIVVGSASVTSMTFTTDNNAASDFSFTGGATFNNGATFSSTAAHNGVTTFNTDADYTYNGTENIAVTSDLAGTVDVISLIATPSSSAGTTQGVLIQQANSANTNGLDNALTINNADTDLAITAAIKLSSSGGGFTNVIDNAGTLISGAELNLLDGHSSALVDTATTGTIAITGTGILGAGSIASGFGAIDVGADNITTTGTVFGNTIDRSTAGQLSIGNGGASATTSIVVGSASVTSMTFTTDNNAASDFSFTGGATFNNGATFSSTAIHNGVTTFNTDADFTYNGTENLAVTSDLAGTVDVISLIATPSSSAGTAQGVLIQQANSANTNGLDNALTINNADTDLAIAAAIKLSSSGGGFTNVIDNAGTLISGAELNLLDGHSSALVDTATTGTIAITGTGILGAGSIASGFGAIDVGADNITTTGTVFGNTHDRSTAGQLSIGNGGASAATSIVVGSASVTSMTFTTDNNAASDFSFTGGATFNNGATFSSTAIHNGVTTFNTDTDFTFNGTENIAVTSDLVGTVDVISLIATPSASAGTAQGVLIQQANSANTNGLDNALTINNADTDLAIAAAIKLSSSGGGFTNVIDNAGTLISGAELNLLDGHSSALVDTATTGTIAITGTGILGAGSIASGFGAIDVGADNITTTGTVAGNTLDRSTSGTLSIGTGQASAITLGGATTVSTAAGGLTVTTGKNLIVNGDTFTDLTGNGLTVSSGALLLQAAASADGLSSTTSSGSGLEVLASGIAMLQGCADTQILKWVEASDVWNCAADASGGAPTLNSITAAGGTTTIANGTNAIVWNWALAATGNVGFSFGETTAASSGGTVLAINTIATSTASPLTVTDGGTGNIVFNLSSTGDLLIQDGGTAFATFDDSGGITFAPTGTSDVIFNQAAGVNLQVTATAASTVDQVVVSNSGQASTTGGVDGIQLTFGSSNASGDALHITPSYAGGGTDALTYNVMEIDAFSPTNGAGADTVNGFSVGNLTDPGATITSNGIKFGTGWDSVISGTTAGTNILAFTNATLSSAGALTLGAAGSTGALNIKGTTSGTVTLNVNATAGTYTWTLPNADAAGCLKSDGAGAISISACGDVHSDPITATGAGTWTKPTSALLVIVDAIGAGGGGGGGASQTGATARTGGSGGGGGAHSRMEYTASNLGSTENYSVGSAGSTGAGGTSGNSGNNGGTGGNTTFGTTVRLFAGGGGGGRQGVNSGAAGSGGSGGGTGEAGILGTAAAVRGGGPGLVTGGTVNVLGVGGQGMGTSITTTIPGAEWGGAAGGGHTAVPANFAGGTSLYGGGGGGVGGGATSAPATINATAGGDTNTFSLTGGGGGAAGASGGVPGAGSNGSTGDTSKSGTGGGGGGGTVTASTTGASGGSGGVPGGGGGGGGVGSNTNSGGSSGSGGRGELRIYTVRGAGADLAEIYCTNDAELTAGDAVSIDPNLRAGVKKTSGAYDPTAIGIISTNPGMTTGDLEEQCVKPVLVALTGRVPLQVSLENGPIKAGDYLTSSSTAGVAMKATKAGQILGQALTGYDGSQPNYVVVFVEHGKSTGSTLADLVSNQPTDPASTMTVQQQALAYLVGWKDKAVETANLSELVTDRVTAGVEVITPSLIADAVSTNTIKSPTNGDVSLLLDKDGKFIIKNKDGSQAFSIDASGNSTLGLNLVALGSIESRGGLRVEGDAIFNGESTFAKLAQFTGDINAQGRVTFNKDTGGTAIIKTNGSRVKITFNKEFAQKPIMSVNLTADQTILPDGTMEDIKTKEQRLFNAGYSYLVSDISTKGFTIVLNKKATEDLRFNWNSVAVKDPGTTEGLPDQTESP